MSLETVVLVASLVLLAAGFWFHRRRGDAAPAAPPAPPVDLKSMLERIDPGRDGSLDAARADREGPGVVDPSILTRQEAGGIPDLTALEELLRRGPDNLEILNLVAYQYYNARRLDDALALYRRGLQLKPGDPVFTFYLANSLYLKGLVGPAREQWTKVLELDGGGRLGKKARERLEKTTPGK